MEKKDKKSKKFDKKTKYELFNEEINNLETRIINEVPPTGNFSINTEQTSNNQKKLEKWEEPKSKFSELPLSHKILKGLSEAKYFKMTPIQRATLPHSLAKRDIMGASKTGSGKTLCFLIPTLENLYRDGWSKGQGLGALIILPTRELAIQTFEVINKIGKYFNFSVGMVIGGNKYDTEQKAINQMNILIGTPGRLLQHMSETPMFNADNLQILIIDEADRVLDEGFEEDINELLTYLPKNRQTLLFSATLTKNLKRLIKINMNQPEYINLSHTDFVLNEEVIEKLNQNELSILKTKQNEQNNNKSSINNLLIPVNLFQAYTIVEPEERLNVLYSFLKMHKTQKILVFVSSRKQVRFFTEVFKHLKLGMLFLDIHGKQSQGKRSNIFYTFSQKRGSVVLFATDIASRGVDFPAIDWVIQLDPPEDIAQYIHRIGRTARYKSQGNSILFVSSKEEEFINELKNKEIDIKKIKFSSNKISNMQTVVRSVLSEHSELISAAEKAISSYLKSINMFSNKKIYNIKNIDLNKLALSYGLVSSPELIFKNMNDENDNNEENDNENKDKDINNEKIQKKKSKLQKLKEKIKQKKLKNQLKDNINNENEEDDEDFLKEKKDNNKLLNKKIERNNNNNENNYLENEENNNSNKDDEIDEENNFYNKIKDKLNKNKEKDKMKEKIRILQKHKEDRAKLKEKDYKKHGLLEEENESEEEENENEENDEKEKNKQTLENEPKIKLNIEHSSIKEKEKAALELLKKKNIFG